MSEQETVMSITKKEFCEHCKEIEVFVESESPIGAFVCSNCGIRKSIENKKLVFNNFGYTFA